MRIVFHPKAKKELDKLESKSRKSVKERISVLSDCPKRGKRLKHSSFWSLRAGEFRAIYEIKGEVVVILFVGHRKRVYSDLSRLF